MFGHFQNYAQNTEFVDALGMYDKKKNHHFKAEKNSELTIYSKLMQNYVYLTEKCPNLEQGVRTQDTLSYRTMYLYLST